MTTHCFIPILGKRMRTTRLDTCGVPPAPGTAGGYLATDGFATVTLSSEIEDGVEIITKKASGALCVNEKQPNSFKRFTVEMEFCGVNPSLLDYMTNATPYLDYAGDIAGFTVAEGPIDKKFALELWTGLSGGACNPGEDSAGGYLLLPFVQAGTLGDISIDGENAVTFSMSGAVTKGGNSWGVGPYLVVADGTQLPAALPTALDPFDHLLLMDTGLASPPIACDPQAMPPVAAQSATAGIPGTWQPFQSTKPATFTAANTAGIDAIPTTAWTAGQYVQGATAGAPGQMHWTGATWALGPKP